MSTSDPQPASTKSSPNAIVIRAMIVLALIGAGTWYAFSVSQRDPLRKVLADGELAITRGDIAMAEKYAREALSRAPRAPETMVYVAQVHVAKQEPDKALELLRQVPDGTPDTPPARAIQATTEMIHLGKFEEAEKLFQEALSQDPSLQYALTNYSLLLRMATMTQERHAIDLRLLELHSATPAILFQMAMGWSLHTNINQMSELIKKNPNDKYLLLAMGDASLVERRFGDGEELLRKAIKKDPEFTEAYYKLGRVLLERNDFKGLVEWNQSLPSNSDNHPGIWQVRGRWAESQGDDKGAARCYWEALKIDINFIEACYSFGQTLIRLQRPDDAKPYLDRARRTEEYIAKVHGLNAVSGGTPKFERVRPVLNDALYLGIPWEAKAWAQLMLLIREDKEVNKVGQSIFENLKDLPLQRTYSKNNVALSMDFTDYAVPDWEQLGTSVEQPETTSSQDSSVEITFEDMAKSAGIEFQYFNSADKRLRGLGKSYEFTGGGVAVIDYDQDSLPDLYFTQGCVFPTDESKSEHTDRLYRNLGDGKFEDVTEQAGIAENRYSQGVSVGDVNNDGYPDLYVANLGHNRLLLNNGDGTFTDVTSRFSVSGSNVWTTSCVIADLNGDQLPDIYAVNYLSDEAVRTVCRTADSEKRLHACIPKQFPSEDDQVFVNLGDGRFRNVTRDAGILLPDGKGLGALVGDLTGSGGNSLFVANDSTANYLFVNNTPPGSMLKFREDALVSGLAFNQAGVAQACMGVAADDFDRNGLIDLFVTNFTEEGSTLYQQQSAGLYIDKTRESGLYDPTVMILGFGTQSIDADLDGWFDLIQTNGHIDTYEGVPWGYEMSPQFFRNLGGGKFKELPASILGPFFSGKYRGRGLARIDWNQDGLEDVAISHIDAPVALLTNTTKSTGHFLALSLRGSKSARDAIGSVVKVKMGDITITRHLTGGDGYQASNERVLYFGLGDRQEVDEVEIRWPNGETQALPKQAAGRSLLVIEGRNDPVLLWEKG
ncbi:MAG: VCBS repeat-containing protein [Planctomycetaceae bacterium]|nr:VCBS repeat-containing protein [Planctomycetaceae bacterium]